MKRESSLLLRRPIAGLQSLSVWGLLSLILTLTSGLNTFAKESSGMAHEIYAKRPIIVKSEGKNTPETLKRAIDFLIANYGAQYPNGKSYLKRLANLGKGDEAGFQKLQREALLNHPHVKGYEWLVEVRDQYWGSHGPMNTLFQNGDEHGDLGGIKYWRSIGGRFEVLAIDAMGNVSPKKTLVEQQEGIVRDADVDFEGKNILFSMRKSESDDYHLYEMKVDGSNLRQLTFGSQLSDVDPIYLADGKILFSSTRDPKFCQCNRHISQNLFTMERDGAKIEQISQNPLSDFHSSLMPDGRVLYSRWEYVDRHFGPSLGLWTSNPDGTMHTLFMGNNGWSPGAILDARAIPGTDMVVSTYGATHDLPWGAIAVVDRSKGMEGRAPIVHIWPEEGRKLITPDVDEINRDLRYRRAIDNFKWLPVKYEDPYPVHNVSRGEGGGYFFVASKTQAKAFPAYSNKKAKRSMKMGLVLLDVFGNEVDLYTPNEPQMGAYGAIPISARKKPIDRPNRVNPEKDHGLLYVNDVYLGDGDEMSAVKPGAIKYLRLIEAPPRRTFDERLVWNIDAQQVGAMNWNLTNNKRILGDVPVEKDGSAFFKVPADTFFQIEALDENKQMVQAMRSGTMVRPGEVQGCVGCHENRSAAPTATNPSPIAMKRAPSEIEPWFGAKRVADSQPFNYLTEVQPVFDRHCVSCHDYDKEAGEVLNLAGDLSFPFNVSYTELMHKSGIRYQGAEETLVSFAGDGPPGVLPAYAWGSHRSRLVRILREGHHDVSLSEEEMQRITTWIDINAVYYGRYESYYPGRNPLLALELGDEKAQAVLGKYSNWRKDFKEYTLNKGHLLNFTRPEKSPALALIEDEKQRLLALSFLQEASQLLLKVPREDQTNAPVRLSANDEFHLTRAQRLKQEQKCASEAGEAGVKYYPFKPQQTCQVE